MARPFLTAEWLDLAVLNFEIDPALLTPWIPKGTELDLWNGIALVSVVGFRFVNTRVLGAAIPFHRDFEEVNLRLYVRRQGGQDTRGVVFIREFVPKRAVAIVANAIYGERYAIARIEHSVERTDARICATYGWIYRGRRSFVSVEAEAESTVLQPHSHEAFILEHYWGYGHSTYRVDHPPWRTHATVKASYEIDGDAVYGAGFGGVLARKPVSVMFAEGSAVSVYKRERGANE